MVSFELFSHNSMKYSNGATMIFDLRHFGHSSKCH